MHPYGKSFAARCASAAQAIAHDETAVARIMLHGFDTHECQAARHAALLAELADGLATLRDALMRTGDWHRTLMMTVSKFGQSARENAAGGTDHGAASAQFAMGGRVIGGLYGVPPQLDALDDESGLFADIDFCRLYANAVAGFGAPLPILRA